MHFYLLKNFKSSYFILWLCHPLTMASLKDFQKLSPGSTERLQLLMLFSDRSSHWVIINSPKDRLCIFPRKAGIFLSFFYIYVKEVKKEKQGHVRNFSGLYQVFIVESSSILSTWVEWFGFQLGDLILLSYSHCLQVCSANRSFSSFSDIWAYSKMLLKYICF